MAWTFLLAGLLNPAQAGLVFQARAMAQIGSVAVTMIMESASRRFLSPARARHDLAQAAGFIQLNRRLALGLLPLVAVALAAILLRKDGALGADFAITLLAVLLIAFARMTSRHATALGAVRKGLLSRLLTGPSVLTLG